MSTMLVFAPRLTIRQFLAKLVKFHLRAVSVRLVRLTGYRVVFSGEFCSPYYLISQTNAQTASSFDQGILGINGAIILNGFGNGNTNNLTVLPCYH